MRKARLRAGVFLAPYHPVNESPTLAFERDLELVRHLDDLGFAEAWFGEHHSAAYEICGSPELMIAAAAQRTKRIRLGTGVVSIPYHNPLMVANRIAQLDHLTFGRLMFGAGPGLLASDAHMLGLDVNDSRNKLDRGLSVITRLFKGEWVTERYDGWYDLEEAHCQVQPMQESLELCVASAFSPSGGRLAAKYGAGMLFFTATVPGGFDALATNWAIACEQAQTHGNRMDVSAVRLVTDMHIAETREAAMAQARVGFELNRDYFRNQSASMKEARLDVPMEQLMEEGQIVVGTPDDAIAQILRLNERIPDFGCLLICEKNWASTEHQKRSYEMIARYVLPAINGDNAVRESSFRWANRNGRKFMDVMLAAAQKASGAAAQPPPAGVD
jgi:limonene 1,2-monooxygenase